MAPDVQTSLKTGGQQQTRYQNGQAGGAAAGQKAAGQAPAPDAAGQTSGAAGGPPNPADPGPGGATYAPRRAPPLRALAGAGAPPTGPDPPEAQPDHLDRLYLDLGAALDVRAHIGETAYLMCRLRAAQQQQEPLQVSWVRSMQILTSGELRYTSDERFKPTHVPGTQDWRLEVHNVQASDEGAYECQVNSEPRPASVTLHLHVMTASVEIIEAPEVRVGEGEQIQLTCRVEFASQAQLESRRRKWPPADGGAPAELEPDHPRGRDRAAGASLEPGGARPSRAASANWQHYIYWYKDNTSLEYNNPRGDVQVERRDLAGGLESTLRLGGATRNDQGVYLCKLLPELNDVRPARAQVMVGAAGASSAGRAAPAAPAAIVLLGLVFALIELVRGCEGHRPMEPLEVASARVSVRQPSGSSGAICAAGAAARCACIQVLAAAQTGGTRQVVVVVGGAGRPSKRARGLGPVGRESS